jgi:hypothetical protein
MERRRSPGVLLSCYAGLIGLAVGHDFVMVFAAITLAATLVQAGSFTLMGLASQYYPTIRRGVGNRCGCRGRQDQGRSADPQSRASC